MRLFVSLLMMVSFAFVRGGDLWVYEGGHERVLVSGGEVSSPRFSVDGRYVLYQQGDQTRITTVDGDAGPWTLPDGYGSAAWSPVDNLLSVSDGRRVAMVKVGGTGLGEPEVLAEGWSGGVWSPDGRLLAVSRATPREGKMFEGTAQVGLVWRTGGPVRVILEEAYPPKGEEPVGGAQPLSWSRDGEWLLLWRGGLTASMSADYNQFAVASARDGKATTLGAAPNVRWAVWDPSGPRLAFVDGAGRSAWQQKQLRVASAPWGGKDLTLTPAGYADRDLAWRPGGGALAFTRSEAKAPPGGMEAPAPGQAIYVVEVGRGQPRKVPGSEGGFGPFWAGDGALCWFKAADGSVTLWREGKELIRGIDLPHAYYGQWDWRGVLDSVE